MDKNKTKGDVAASIGEKQLHMVEPHLEQKVEHLLVENLGCLQDQLELRLV